MEKEKRRKKSFHNSGVGGILARSLTRDQIARLLEVVFAAGDAARYLDEFRKTDPDMNYSICGKQYKYPEVSTQMRFLFLSQHLARV